jgi:translocation protein SEC63
MVQGVWGPESDLSTILPASAANYLSRIPRKSGRVGRLLEFVRMSPDQWPALSELSGDDKRDLETVVKDLPNVVVTAEAAVVDEQFIAQGDVVTLTVTMKHANLRDDKQAVPMVYAPRFPVRREEQWSFLLIDHRGYIVQYTTNTPVSTVVQLH